MRYPLEKIIFLITAFLISADLFAQNPNARCSNDASECTGSYSKPLTETQILQLSNMNAQAAEAERQRALAAEAAAKSRQAEQNRKTPAEIEKETKKKWCSDMLANIPIAISRCKSEATATYARHMALTCKGETSRTVEGGITVYIFGGTISYTTSCSEIYVAQRDAT